MPYMPSRVYTSFSVGSCADGQAINSITVVTPPTGCVDAFTFAIDMTEIAKTCGWIITSGEIDGKVYDGYHGALKLVYNEDLNLHGTAFPRLGEVVIPAEFLLQTSYSISATNVDVNSAFDLKAALVGQIMQPESGYTEIQVATAVSWPYQIDGVEGAVTIGGAAVPAGITASVLDVSEGTPVSTLYNTDCVGPANANDYTDNNVCTRISYIRISHNTACALDGTYTLSAITISCAPELSAADCPIETPDTTSTTTITLDSEHFCTGSESASFIAGAITIDRFIPVDAADLKRGVNDDPMHSMVYNEALFLRLDLTGLQVFDAIISYIAVDVDDTGTPVPPGIPFTITGPLGSFGSTSAPTGLALGWDVTDQSFLMYHNVDSGLHTAFTSQPTSAARVSVGIILNLVFDFGSRRRTARTKLHHIYHTRSSNKIEGGIRAMSSFGIKNEEQVVAQANANSTTSENSAARGDATLSTQVPLYCAGLILILQRVVY
ncbi:hypothetical protein SARC_02815 [Sphaeroforma arctica JP610]|uniref:Uncharacterized protein n=1 Tax=Sphaeroforma arctica JP610 TaxID=667725 RepID=A0A0L0G7L9_9EUKA|nr:hypothetical protein SARC_02815 [Sphaeroforma arctica JP610]KNC84995.1 hypothetical protein SARC_02815 [Sphaeroforma arctica JP610]|eukprot:XP_014158897.1 hypothetical protein SARC_02815 [Sphaeroforma arctica JP610]